MSIERNDRVGFAERVHLNQEAVLAALKGDH
jgi:hypothetical protein